MYKDVEKQELNPWDNALFRAKRKDNGELISGCLVVFEGGQLCPKQAFIIPRISTTSIDYQGCRTIGGFVEVDPATICRFTGLYDKHKKMIFEKDIVKNHMGFEQVVEYQKGSFLFRDILDYVYAEWQGETFWACDKHFENVDENITSDTVVGTIFDYPPYLAYVKEKQEDG